MRIYALTVCAFLAACSAVSGPPSLPRGSQPVAASPSSVARPQLLGGKRDQILYAFNGVSDGAFPGAGLLENQSGSLYGTTPNGGSANLGTVFKLTPAGTGYSESVIYSFQGGNDAADPGASLIEDQSGALFGTAGGGTAGAGAVFKLTPAGGGYTESVLYSFPGGAGGADPQSALVADAHRALYGTTREGGINSKNCDVFAAYSCGVVYKLTPAGEGYGESVVYEFQGYAHGDGGNPSGAPIVAKNGTLYGVTEDGGNGSCRGGYGALMGCGTIFKLTPSSGGYTESLLYQFQGYYTGDGRQPSGALLADKHGGFYGTTSSGGRSGSGTVFKLTPAGSSFEEKIIYSFDHIKGQQDGQSPDGVIADGTGSLYGATSFGGLWGQGTVFKLTPTGKKYSEKLLCQFRDHHDGQGPNGGLISEGSGWLYGTTIYGGNPGHGTVFKVQE